MTRKTAISARITHGYAAGAIVGGSHFFLASLFQAEALWFSQQGISFSIGQAIVENLLISLLFAFAASILFSTSQRVGIFLAASILNIFIFIDFSFYKLFLQHLSSSFLEGYQTLSPALASSVLYELDRWFYLNLLALSGTLYLLYRGLLRSRSQYARPKKFSIIGFFSLTAAFVATSSLSPEETYRHPIAVHAHHLLSSSFGSQIATWSSPTSVNSSSHTERTTPVSDPYLTQLLTSAQQATRPLNVVLVVLESVGSIQLLNERGEISPTKTPTLHALAQRGLLFDNLYSPFPATVRSHVALNTGGNIITSSSVFEELSLPYRGPTLAGTLREHGYRTALFSSADLSFENMDGMYANMGYDKIFDFGKAPAAFQAQHRLHSWGAKEESVIQLATQWMTNATPKKPFFLTYISNATHHPYSVPPAYIGPHQGDDERSRYYNSLHYTDHALEEILLFLDDRQLTDNTLIAVIGDHGEAFGDIHHRNVLHANYLYEENVKNFLLIANPRLLKAFHASHRLAALGDVMPTLLAVANIDEIKVPGQNLLSPNYSARTQYFYKNAAPALLGLRDDQWKFIAEQTGNNVELYDLLNDPNEQTNIAALHPDKVASYRTLAAQWYANSDIAYKSQLDHEFLNSKAQVKDIAVGVETAKASPRFTASPTITANSQPVIQTGWWPPLAKETLGYVWRSPSGKEERFDYTTAAGWRQTWVSYDGILPMLPGTWSLSIMRKGARIAFVEFEVLSR